MAPTTACYYCVLARLLTNAETPPSTLFTSFSRHLLNLPGFPPPHLPVVVPALHPRVKTSTAVVRSTADCFGLVFSGQISAAPEFGIGIDHTVGGS